MNENLPKRSLCKESVKSAVLLLISMFLMGSWFQFLLIFHGSAYDNIFERFLRWFYSLFGNIFIDVVPIVAGILFSASIVYGVKGFRKCRQYSDQYVGKWLGCGSFLIVMLVLLALLWMVIEDFVFNDMFYSVLGIVVAGGLLVAFVLIVWFKIHYDEPLFLTDEDEEKEDSTSE